MAEAIVTLPDGRRVKLTGPTRQAIEQQAMALGQQGAPQGASQGNLRQVIPAPGMPQGGDQGLNRARLIEGLPGTEINTASRVDPGAGDAFFRAGVEQFADNATQLPSLLLNLVANSSLNPARMLPPDSALRDKLTPALTDRTIPLPTGEQLVGGAAGLGQIPGALLRGENANVAGRIQSGIAGQQELMKEHPGSAMFGRAAGDAATLVTGRAPLARGLAPAAKKARTRLENAARRNLDNQLPPEVLEKTRDVLSQKLGPGLRATGQQLARGVGKAGEVGLEGATLALLDRQDPQEMFFYGAGAQAAGSVGLFLMEKPLKRLLPAVGTAYVASEMFKAAAPGVDQDFFESKDFAIHKATMAVALGTAGALTGAGRLRGPAAEQFPVWLDAVTSAPRGAVLGRINELWKASEAGDELPLRTMEKFSTNPRAFNSNIQNSLARAMSSDKPDAWSKEVRRLHRDSKAFREAMSEGK